MKKIFPILIVVGVIIGIQVFKKPSDSKSIRSNEKTAFVQPEKNQDICNKENSKEIYLKITGNFDGKKVKIFCNSNELKYHYYSDYVKDRGTYEVRCEKSGYYVSMGIRNPIANKLIRPHIPYREVPPTFNFSLEKNNRKVTQKDTKRNMLHNKESLLYIKNLKREDTKTSLTGCMKFDFKEQSHKLVSGQLDINFNVKIKTK